MLAYETANLSAAASAGKLKKFSHYLAQIKQKQPQGPEEMLAALRELNARGAPMTIRKVERQGSNVTPTDVASASRRPER